MDLKNNYKDRINNKFQSYINNLFLPKNRVVSLNEQIVSHLVSKKVFSAVRFGNTENIVFNKILNNKPVESLLINYMHYTAGFFPNSLTALKNEFYKNYLNSLSNIDYLGIAGNYGFSKNLIKIFNGNFFLDNSPLDPIYLTNYDLPWTSFLKDKRVLVISSHRNSILSQLNNLKKIWNTNYDKICCYNLIDVIKCPNYALDPPSFKIKWEKTIDDILEKVSFFNNIDLVLIGAGAYAPVISAKLKSLLSISSITTCGATQLFFGIKGARWNKKFFPEHQKIINKYWITPLKIDRPKNFSILTKTEGSYTYW